MLEVYNCDGINKSELFRVSIPIHLSATFADIWMNFLTLCDIASMNCVKNLKTEALDTCTTSPAALWNDLEAGTLRVTWIKHRCDWSGWKAAPPKTSRMFQDDPTQTDICAVTLLSCLSLSIHSKLLFLNSNTVQSHFLTAVKKNKIKKKTELSAVTVAV